MDIDLPQGGQARRATPTIGGHPLTAGIGIVLLLTTALFGDTAKKIIATSPDVFGFLVLAAHLAIPAIGGTMLAKLASDKPPKGWSKRELWVGSGAVAVGILAASIGVVLLQPAIGRYCYYQRAIAFDDPPLLQQCHFGAIEDHGETLLQGETTWRIALLQQAIALDPGLLGAHYHLGLLLVYAGDYEEGLAAMRVAGRLAVAEFAEGTGAVEVDGVYLDQVFANLAWEFMRQGEPLVASGVAEKGLWVLQTREARLEQEGLRAYESVAQSRYTLQVIHAWANLQLGYYGQTASELVLAEEHLATAGAPAGHGAGLRCVRAQLTARRQERDPQVPVAADARACLGEKQFDWEPMSPEWIAFAAEHGGTADPVPTPTSPTPTTVIVVPPAPTPTTPASAPPNPSTPATATRNPRTPTPAAPRPTATATATRRPVVLTPLVPQATLPVPRAPKAK